MRKLLHRGGKRVALRDVGSDVANHDPEAGVLGLILQCLETLHQRQARREERSELLREEREFTQGKPVGLRFLL